MVADLTSAPALQKKKKKKKKKKKNISLHAADACARMALLAAACAHTA